MANAMIFSFTLSGPLWTGANQPPVIPPPASGRRSLRRWAPEAGVAVTAGWSHPGRMAAAAIPATQLFSSHLFFDQVVTGIAVLRHFDSGWLAPARWPVNLWAAGTGGRPAFFDSRLATTGKSSSGRVRAIL